MSRETIFRQRLRDGDPLIGTWAKTPSHVAADVLGLTDLDCICIDAEHAPFDRLAIDASISALRAADMPALVRVPHATTEHILNALDCGADGVVAPHIKTEDEAIALALASRYGPGGRGYAGSSRAAAYTTRGMAENLKIAADQTTVIAQIEDIEGVENVDAIAAVDGIDCLFIGRIDLTIALQAPNPTAKPVVDAVAAVCAAGVKHDRRIGMFVSDMNEIPQWREAGASLFILKSDHSFMLEGARMLRSAFDELTGKSTR